MLHVLRRLDHFEPRHVGAMQAYLRQSVINRIRDEVRKDRPPPGAVRTAGRSAVGRRRRRSKWRCEPEAYRALSRRRSTASVRAIAQLVVARIEAQWSHGEIAKHFGHARRPTRARMAVDARARGV